MTNDYKEEWCMGIPWAAVEIRLQHLQMLVTMTVEVDLESWYNLRACDESCIKFSLNGVRKLEICTISMQEDTST